MYPLLIAMLVWLAPESEGSPFPERTARDQSGNLAELNALLHTSSELSEERVIEMRRGLLTARGALAEVEDENAALSRRIAELERRLRDLARALEASQPPDRTIEPESRRP